MQVINLQCIGENLVITNSPDIFSGDIGSVKLSVVFDATWSDLGKTAVCYDPAGAPYFKVLDLNNECIIPEEALAKEGKIFIGIIGSDGSKVITSQLLRFSIGKGATTLEVIDDPTPDVWSQILGLYGDVVSTLKKLDQKKANVADLVNGLNFKGTVYHDYLPQTGNQVGDYWYCEDTSEMFAWNGTAWYCIGEINHTEVDFIVEDLENVTGCKRITFTTGKYIDCTTTPVDITNFKSNSNINCAVLACVPGDIFTVTATSYSKARAYCFLDESNNVIGSLVSSSYVADSLVVVAPPGATHLIINDYNDGESYSYVGAKVKESMIYKGDISKNSETYGNAISNITKSGTYYLGTTSWSDRPTGLSNYGLMLFVQRYTTNYLLQTAISLKGTIKYRVIKISDNSIYTTSGVVYDEYGWFRNNDIQDLYDRNVFISNDMPIAEDYDGKVSNFTRSGIFLASKNNGWTDLPDNSLTWIIRNFVYFGSNTYILQKATSSTIKKSSNEYFRIVNSDGTVYSDWEPSAGNSVYKSKKVSIFGDSISTFEGYLPTGNRAYYKGNNCGVSSVSDTWWYKAINALEMDLHVNNSWSGRTVSNLKDATENNGAWKQEEINKLSANGVAPDVIIIKLGINDFNNSKCNIGSYDCSTALPTVPSGGFDTFRESYATMLDRIMKTYPLAEVWCCTLMSCERNYDRLGFPEINKNGVSLNQYNDAIRQLAGSFGAKVIDHMNCGITMYNLNVYCGDYDQETNGGLHPNASGHSLIANSTIATMDGSVKIRY